MPKTMTKQTERILRLVTTERKRQDRRWGPPDIDRDWPMLALEELGEAAQEFNKGSTLKGMIELVEAIAVLVSWLEAMPESQLEATESFFVAMRDQEPQNLAPKPEV
jgi:hypothetical protein